MLRVQGPTDALAYGISWHTSWFEDQKDEIVRIILPFLHSDKDWQVAATVKTLGFLVHLGTFKMSYVTAMDIRLVGWSERRARFDVLRFAFVG